MIELFSYPTPKESLSQQDIDKIKNIISELVTKEYNRLSEIRKVETYIPALNLFEESFMNYESASEMLISYLDSLRYEKKGWFMVKTVWYDKPSQWDFDRYASEWLMKIPDNKQLSFEDNRKRYNSAKSRIYTAKDILRRALISYNN